MTRGTDDLCPRPGRDRGLSGPATSTSSAIRCVRPLCRAHRRDRTQMTGPSSFRIMAFPGVQWRWQAEADHPHATDGRIKSREVRPRTVVVFHMVTGRTRTSRQMGAACKRVAFPVI
jgi:hypothetical protein